MSVQKFESIMQGLHETDLFVLDEKFKKENYVKINLSQSNTDLQKIDVSSSEKLSVYIENYLKTNNSKVAYGGYLEVRDIYKRSSHFNHLNSKDDERNIHLGIDLWQKEGTKVIAPIEGIVHSFGNNKNFGDYGPTIILKHLVNDFQFFTLYGHLSSRSIDVIKVGQKINKLDVIGEFGNSNENGDYPPHLHFQLIIDIGDSKGDYPGVSNLKDFNYFKQNCPNPNIFLDL